MIRIEREAIEAALRQAGGNVSKAAALLGASRRTLQNRMREYGMPHGKAGRRKRLLPYRKRSRWIAGAVGVAAAIGGTLFVGRYLARSSSV